MNLRNGLAVLMCLAIPATSFADFRYSETTQITGGSLVSMTKFVGAFSKSARTMSDPVESTILIKGNRMANIHPDHTQIIDLDQETITEIDTTKKQYSVMTFQEMKQAIEDAVKKAQEQQQQQKPQPQEKSSTPAPEMKFKVEVTNTGAAKDVAGLSAKEAVLKMSLDAKDQQSGQTGGMAMTNDMWMAPEIPGYDQVREFNKRFAQKMGDTFSAAARSMLSPAMLGAQPGMMSGMADMAKEMSKLHGVPVYQTMRMGTTLNGQPLPSASEAPLPKSNGPSGNDIAQTAANNAATSATDTAASNAESKAGSHMGSFGGVAGSLGNLGFGGFHKKKPAAAPAAQPETPAAGATPDYSVLMESTTQMTAFSSSSVDASLFAIPAGFTKVANEYQKKQ
jgi:hypothetical protein